MAGLVLNMSGYGAAGSGQLPTAASQPAGATVSQQAFGISTGTDAGPALAANGALIAGAAGALLLAWQWWTLPR